MYKKKSYFDYTLNSNCQYRNQNCTRMALSLCVKKKKNVITILVLAERQDSSLHVSSEFVCARCCGAETNLFVQPALFRHLGEREQLPEI